MDNIGMIQDIPKIYTALSEWIACVVYLAIYNKSIKLKLWQYFVLIMILVFLIVDQSIIGSVAVSYWIPGMIVAVMIMYLGFFMCSNANWITSGYWIARAFVLAEMVASLEWQIYFFASKAIKIDLPWVSEIFMIIIYGVVFTVIYVIESRLKNIMLNVSKKEFFTAAVIGVVCFCLSNLSYVYANTPFSSPFAREAFNIRTLVDLGGYAFLMAYHIQRCEDSVSKELDAIQNILYTQYSQYKQSQESIQIINHKYHDLKHQINILRNEKSIEKKEAYLDEIEQGINDYETMFKTGNSVLDTLLTSAGLKCSHNNITFTCVADGMLLKQLYVMDICTIFGNALDNAIECEVQIEDKEKRLIHVSVSRMNEFVLIRIENYIQEQLKFNGEFPITTKKDIPYHGFGLKSIKYSVEKYRGTMSVKVDENWFVINILIPVIN